MKIEIVDMVSEKFPDDPNLKNALGAYDWGRNTIFVSRKVMRGGSPIDNFDIDFVIRHEIGHAVNAKLLEKPGLYYAKPVRISNENSLFVGAFNRDLKTFRIKFCVS